MTNRAGRIAFNIVLALLASASARAQTAGSPPDADTARLLAELSREVHELRVEVTSLRVAWHEHRMEALRKQIEAAESDRRLAEYEDSAAHDEILGAEVQLAGSDLDAEERAELTSIKNELVSEAQQRLGNRRSQTSEREAALRSEWDRERAAAEGYRRTMRALQPGPAPSPADR